MIPSNYRLWTLLVVSMFLVASTAMAATAWIAVPSAPDASNKVTISGGDLAPASSVEIQIEQPDGEQTVKFATVNADGNFSLEIQPVTAGSYKVKVLDGNGSEVGSGNFISTK